MGRKTLVRELEQLDDAYVLDEVLAEIRDEGMCARFTEDLNDPGPEVEVGEEGRVAVEDLGVLERIILPNNNLLPVHFLEEGATKQRAVARIAWKNPPGSARGTGWLVGRDIMMTNNHVMATKQLAKDLRAEFNYQFGVDGSPETPDAYDFDPDGFFYTNAALDFTLVKVKCRSLRLQLPLRVARTDDGEYLVLDEMTPATPAAGAGTTAIGGLTNGSAVATTIDSTVFRPPYVFCIPPSNRWGSLQLPAGGVSYATHQHVNIVQHPRGRRKEVAVQENSLANIYTNHVRYTTDTDLGSSGSPVFNNGWDLLAIHHAGGAKQNGMWINNQGVRIDRIVTDIRANFAAGSYVRNQLNI